MQGLGKRAVSVGTGVPSIRPRDDGSLVTAAGRQHARLVTSSDAAAPSSTVSSRVWLLRRWPTWFGVGGGLLIWGADAASLAEVLVLLALVYVVVVAARRRKASWPVLLLCFWFQHIRVRAGRRTSLAP